MRPVWKHIIPHCTNDFIDFETHFAEVTNNIVEIGQQLGFEKLDFANVIVCIESNTNELDNRTLINIDEQRAYEEQEDNLDNDDSVEVPTSELATEQLLKIIVMVENVLEHIREVDPNIEEAYKVKTPINKKSTPSTSGPKRQSTIFGAFEKQKRVKQENNTFVADTVNMCLKANIPLHKLDHPAVREYLVKYIPGSGALPAADESLCRRTLKKKKETKSGQAATKIRKWIFEDQMSFLIPHFQERSTISNISAEIADVEVAEGSNLEDEVPAETQCTNKETGDVSLNSQPNTPSSRCSTPQRKRDASKPARQASTASAELMKFLVRQKEENLKQPTTANDAFFDSIAKTVNKLKPINQNIIRSQIYSMVSTNIERPESSHHIQEVSLFNNFSFVANIERPESSHHIQEVNRGVAIVPERPCTPSTSTVALSKEDDIHTPPRRSSVLKSCGVTRSKELTPRVRTMYIRAKALQRSRRLFQKKASTLSKDEMVENVTRNLELHIIQCSKPTTSSNAKESVKRKRVVLTIAQKLEILNGVEKGLKIQEKMNSKRTSRVYTQAELQRLAENVYDCSDLSERSDVDEEDTDFVPNENVSQSEY
ncbi:hypothetical protein QE152_g40488 [Popillia japonica]|uniref:Uncharacterized protein n=1 Tax=Popillia japonica TaxID=7064 RepID=A0AAW1HFX4_POPJA